MNLTSIIIPIYNSEKYLIECLESVVHQTYKNIEIILINDGSTDNSKDICTKYLQEYSNIKYFEKSNSGVSDTRNIGLKHASGKYTMFIDSDDVYELNYVEEMVKSLEKNQSQLAYSSYYKYYKNKKIINQLDSSQNKNLLIELFSSNYMQGYLGNKIYLTNIIKKYNLSFAKNINTSEDLLFNYNYIQNIEKVSYCNNSSYIYRMRKSSLLNNQKTDLSVFKIIDYITTKDTEFYNYAEFFYLNIYFKYYKILKKEHILNNYPKRTILDVLKSKALTDNRKIKLIAYRILPISIRRLKTINKINFFE